jgi:hypothetical protein
MSYDLPGITTAGAPPGRVDHFRVDHFSPSSNIGGLVRRRDTPSALAMLGEFMRDRVELVKTDGRRFGQLRAAVRPSTISVLDVAHPIDAGDHIERTLPNGTIESYLVVRSALRHAVYELPAMYKLTVRRTDADDQSPCVVAEEQGGGGRARPPNAGDALATPADLFAALAHAIANGVEGRVERERLAAELAAMQAAAGTPAFLGRYTRFVAAGGDHMSLLAPFIPALTRLLES